MFEKLGESLTSRRVIFNMRYCMPAMQYNKVFKPEYLPARVRYNQFFLLVLSGALIYSAKQNTVS